MAASGLTSARRRKYLSVASLFLALLGIVILDLRPWLDVYMSVLAVLLGVPLALAAIIVNRSMRWHWGAVLLLQTTVLLGVLLPLHYFHLPLRVMFPLFQGRLEQIRVSNEWQEGVQFGCWKVLMLRRDEQGGVYVLTGTAPDIVDNWHFGFAHHPHPEYTSFGGVGYRLSHMRDDWYVFVVQD